MRRAKEMRDRDKMANGRDVGGIQRNKIDVIRDLLPDSFTGH